jgi:RNA polymerase sigma-70 factor (ECF subfamily)
MYTVLPWEPASRVDTERQIFLELVDRHGAAVLAMLRRLCGNRHDADDVFQEVAARVWLNLHSMPRLRSPRAWLLTIAYRRFLDHRARVTSHVSLLDTDAPERDWPAADPSRLAERSEEARMLDQAVQKLPESLRSIIVLHYTGGLSLRETAHLMDISVGTAKSRLNTALTQLRRRLS